MRIAVLAWGSLMWDSHPFDKLHDGWKLTGPQLKLEFSRVSRTRDNALTLVLDNKHGELCQVAYSFSKRTSIEDAIGDLKDREQTNDPEIIGRYIPGRPFETPVAPEVRDELQEWAEAEKINGVIWTNLASNFKSKVKQPFSVDNAIAHLQKLAPAGRATAAEYVSRAPDFIDTPLRRALQVAPWFKN